MKLQLKSKFLLIFSFALFLSNFSFAQTNGQCTYLKPLEVKKKDFGNMLAWTTSEENDVKLFVIEKSSNGIDFERVGDQQGAGFSKKKNVYRFMDLALPQSVSYYRILHYSTNGSFTTGEIVSIGKSSQNPSTRLTNTDEDKK